MITNLLLSLVILGTTGQTPSEELKKDKEMLQGRWQFVFVEDASGVSDEAKRNLDKIFWVFKQDITYWEAGNDGSHVEMRFSLHNMSGRKCIDLTAVDAPYAKLGIYQLDGDNLKICICRNPDKPRPTEFTLKAGSENLVVSMKRAKN